MMHRKFEPLIHTHFTIIQNTAVLVTKPHKRRQGDLYLSGILVSDSATRRERRNRVCQEQEKKTKTQPINQILFSQDKKEREGKEGLRRLRKKGGELQTIFWDQNFQQYASAVMQALLSPC